MSWSKKEKPKVVPLGFSIFFKNFLKNFTDFRGGAHLFNIVKSLFLKIISSVRNGPGRAGPTIARPGEFEINLRISENANTHVFARRKRW